MKHLLVTTIAAVLLVGCGPKAPKGIVHIYAQEGDIVAVKQHLAAGTDVNAKDDYLGMTILQSAALGGQKEIVELLIAKGADVNAKDWEGNTPLDMAVSKEPRAEGKKEIANLLRKHGGKTAEELKGGEPVAEAARAPSKSSKSRSSSSKTSSRLSSGSRPTTGRSSGTTSSRSGSSPSRTSSSRSGSVSSLGGTRTTRAVPTRARRTYPKPPPMKGGDPAVQALEMMHQKDLAESKGVPMPPLPFQQQLEDAPPADAIRDDRPPMPPVPGGPIPPGG